MTRPIGLLDGPPHETKARLLDAGLALLLERGYNGTGVQDVLAATGVPKGSFYHHFTGKEDFALQVIDRYMAHVHAQWDEILADPERPPLACVRAFFERTMDKYREQGHLGCMLGALGQELSGTSEVFRRRIESCLAAVAARVAGCLEEARRRGDLAPEVEPRALADALVDCWEGAALRARLGRSPAPLAQALDFWFRAAMPA